MIYVYEAIVNKINTKGEGSIISGCLYDIYGTFPTDGEIYGKFVGYKSSFESAIDSYMHAKMHVVPELNMVYDWLVIPITSRNANVYYAGLNTNWQWHPIAYGLQAACITGTNDLVEVCAIPNGKTPFIILTDDAVVSLYFYRAIDGSINITNDIASVLKEEEENDHSNIIIDC